MAHELKQLTAIKILITTDHQILECHVDSHIFIKDKANISHKHPVCVHEPRFGVEKQFLVCKKTFFLFKFQNVS